MKEKTEEYSIIVENVYKTFNVYLDKANTIKEKLLFLFSRNKKQKREVLKDINLHLEGGKVYGLKGKNGSGKTMLMRAVCGLILPTGGSITINGEQLGKQISFPRSVGILIENPSFIPGYTGLKNLSVLAAIQKRVGEDEIRETLEKIGLDPDDKRTYRKYSLGMKQRLGIVLALLPDSDLIILDEPTAMLDPNGRKEVIRAVRALNDVEEITVILITHYMEEIIHADRAIVMDEGKIAMEGTPREIFSQVEKLKSLRLDVPQVTLLAHELKQNGVPLPDGILTTEELVTALGY